MKIKIKMTKEMYKTWDSYNRRLRWHGKQLIEIMKAQYGMG